MAMQFRCRRLSRSTFGCYRRGHLTLEYASSPERIRCLDGGRSGERWAVSSWRCGALRGLGSQEGRMWGHGAKSRGVDAGHLKLEIVGRSIRKIESTLGMRGRVLLVATDAELLAIASE